MNPLDELHLGLRRRLALVLQTEAAECGLACLAMISGHHGNGCDIAQLRRRFGLSAKGATLKDLMDAADQLGLLSRPLRLEAQELPLLQAPCILHWDLNHFVVLKKATAEHVLIHDPAAGARRLPLAEALKHFTGVALELAPGPQFERAEAPPRMRWSILVGRIAGLKQSLALLALMALALEVFAVVSPFFMQWTVDEALVAADADLLLTLVAGFFLLLLIRVAVTAMRGWMLIAISGSLKASGRSNLFSHLIQLPASYFESRHLGDIMARFASQESIMQALTTDMLEAVLDGLMSALTMAVMLLYAPGLAALVLAGAMLYGLLRCSLYAPLRHASMEAIVWSARRDSHFLETLRGMKTIKLFNAQRSRRAQWLNLLVQTINRQIATQKLGLAFRVGNMLLAGAITILVVWIGAQKVLDNSFSVGMLLAFISYKEQFLARVTSLTDKALDLRLLRLHAERLADIALAEPEPRRAAPDSVGARAPAAIEVRELRFQYGANEPWILDGLNFRIEAGESVAIVGASGCGKTTLLRILASLLAPSSGEVLIDGRPLTPAGLEPYRSMIGVVLQDDQLFAGSIADNICFFAEQPSPQRIRECAQEAAIDEDISAMPMAYHTLIGDMGTMLSGGQKQRVLIARALYREPAILYLDEATSHLDIAREHAVNATIGARSMTRVIVAHRKETILSADRMIVLDKGRVINDLRLHGSAEALLRGIALFSDP